MRQFGMQRYYDVIYFLEPLQKRFCHFRGMMKHCLKEFVTHCINALSMVITIFDLSMSKGA
jgi:hypothetical protein